ncbi:MAG: carbon storage regulator [Geminicoccaceae bacterium]|nr:carbon storage regulator [Geminicoccaceae bacterium]MCB2009824.1 carbon storage regulator [Geminicoccaceae bacterium]
MLYLTRRAGEAVIINNSIEVRVIELKGKMVKLGFNFPANATVLREEIHRQVREQNEEAAAGIGMVEERSKQAKPVQPSGPNDEE